MTKKEYIERLGEIYSTASSQPEIDEARFELMEEVILEMLEDKG